VRTPLLIATAALTAVLLAGCGGNDPAPSPSPPPSPTASSTGRVAPPLPPAATAHTKAGAIAFVRHYIDLINYTQATGDTGPIRTLESRQCSSCRSANNYIQRLYERGGRITGGAARVEKTLDALPNPESHGFTIDVLLTSGAQIVQDPGRQTQHLQGARLIATVQVAPSGKTWRVNELSRAR